MTRLFLGVDGGQSSTTALIGDTAGRVLGSGVGGPCNHVGAADGARKLASAVEECVGMACSQAGLDRRGLRFEAACFGMSGGPEDKQAILAGLLPSQHLIVTTDAVIALAGATAGEPGIIAIAGTGSIAFGRNPEDRTMRAGGWGHIFGDEGSAFDIARQALRAVLRAEEGWGPSTSLRDLLLAAAGAAHPHDLLHLFYTDDWPRSRVARLAPLVDQAARDSDPVARNLLLAASQQLALLAASVLRRLWPPGHPVVIAYIGGVFLSRILLERFRQLVELEEGVRCAPPIYGPAAGALLEAYRAAGLQPRLKPLPELNL